MHLQCATPPFRLGSRLSVTTTVDHTPTSETHAVSTVSILKHVPSALSAVLLLDVLVVAMYSWHHFSHRSNVLRLLLSLSEGHASHSCHGTLRRSPFWQSTLDCNISELIGDRTEPSWEMPPRYCTYAGQGCLSGICRLFHNPNSARRTLAGVTRIRTFCLNVCDVSTHVVRP